MTGTSAPFIFTMLWMQLKNFLPKIHPLLIKYNGYMKLNNWVEKKMSRKLFLLYVVIVLATLGAFVPPIVVWALSLAGKTIPAFTILGSTEWVSMISLVVTTYFGSNVWEKHVALSNGIPPNQLDNSVMQAKGSSQQVSVKVDVSQQDDAESVRDALRHGQ